jgi:hypothetical protein
MEGGARIGADQPRPRRNGRIGERTSAAAESGE